MRMKMIPKPIRHRLIRKAAKAHQTPLDRFSIRVARTSAEYADAFFLVKTTYQYMGYIDLPSGESSLEQHPWRITQGHVLPESTVLVAYENDTIVGTMTITMDSAAGLPVDVYHRDHTNQLRQRGARIAEYGCLSIVRRCSGSGLINLLYLAAYHLNKSHLGATQVMIDVHPKAADVYCAIMGFTKVGEAMAHKELNMDIIGLSIDDVTFKRHLTRNFKRPLSSGFSLAEHFLMDEPPQCIELPPPMSEEALMRWKMSREVFQDLFIARSQHLDSLDGAVLEQLKRSRTNKTLVSSGPSHLRAISGGYQT